MNTPNEDQIRAFLDDQVELWNAGKRDELFAAYREIAPTDVKIEYIGGPVLDGWPALEQMWEQFGDKVTIEKVQTLVNGNEAACYLRNHVSTEQGVNISPSIEIYRFDGGTMLARYFYQR